MQRIGPRQAIGLVSLCIVLGTMSGCARVTAVYRSPADVIAVSSGAPLDLRLTTGERYTISNSRIQNDSLYATARGSSAPDNISLVVPVSSIATLVRAERGPVVSDAVAMTAATITLGVLVAAIAVLGMMVVYR